MRHSYVCRSGVRGRYPALQKRTFHKGAARARSRSAAMGVRGWFRPSRTRRGVRREDPYPEKKWDL